MTKVLTRSRTAGTSDVRSKTKTPKVSTRARPQAARRVLRDGVRTKARILEIAGEEFASRGYDGARVDEIARRSKVSKNLIYHYFNSKDALFIAVLEEAYQDLHERHRKMALDDKSPQEGVRRLVKEVFTYWSQSNRFIGYLNSENFHKARHIKKSQNVRSAYVVLIGNIKRLLAAGEREGVFRRDVDPVQLYISISAMAYHYFSNQHTFSVVFNEDFTAKGMLSRRLQHIEDVVMGYLCHKSCPS